MNNFFSAEKARKMTSSTSNGIMHKELTFIYEEIRKAITKGNSSIKFFNYSEFSKMTIAFLENKGFKVEYFTGCQWDPADDLIISW